MSAEAALMMEDIYDTEYPTIDLNIDIPSAFQFLFEPHRYKSARGGRGGGKSFSYADALLIIGAQRKIRVLCTRELQSTIADSVHKLLSDEIARLKLQDKYEIQRNTIKGINGTEFLFKGLRFNIDEIKSTEGVDYCWVEEAQSVSEESWKVLIPTIRNEGSEIWLSWNTGEEKDATYQRFVVNPPEDCVSVIINYDQNPFFPSTLDKERRYCYKVDKDAYANIWDGLPRFISDALVFKDKFIVGEFEAPKGVKFRYGADWGFSKDPTALIRNFIIGNDLYIDYEACGVGVEFEDLPALFDSVPNVRDNKIIADSARPETISYVKRQGFAIVSCKKGQKTTKLGFVRDGIEYIRKFEHIYIHTRCKNTIEEFQHYSFKKDRDGRILPILIDSFNHVCDALRYSLEDLIQGHVSMADFMGLE